MRFYSSRDEFLPPSDCYFPGVLDVSPAVFDVIQICISR